MRQNEQFPLPIFGKSYFWIPGGHERQIANEHDVYYIYIYHICECVYFFKYCFKLNILAYSLEGDCSEDPYSGFDFSELVLRRSSANRIQMHIC